ncbi:MAG: hypothetical protein NTX50_27900, partial [Candidatus Sumerlaeota bacterium]|nr:hypothetical protein [Candidatus Sumerlaeota bacterium]
LLQKLAPLLSAMLLSLHQKNVATVVAVLWLAILVQFAAGAEPGGSFIYRAPRGVEYEITPDGLSSIRVGARQLTAGSWSAFNAEDWFKAGTGAVKAGKTDRKEFKQTSPNSARVIHVKGDLLCIFDYAFEGEDVTISARIENNHADAPLAVVGFSGLTFTFDRAPDGVMNEQHISYFQAHGIRLCHPSDFAKIGGSYARGDAAGVGVSPWRTGLARTLILWDYTDWNQGKREKLPSRKLLYFVADPIPPRGVKTFDMKLRVSPDVDWKHLLEPYREHFQKTFGSVRYKADYRWIVTDYLNHSQRVVSATNPYGFHPGHRRIDTAEGAKAFCDTIIPALAQYGGQGVIVWGQGGDDPRGAMYRPDFDVLPPEVERHWPAIAQRFKEAGMKLGVAARPRDMAVRMDWKQDRVISINPDDAGHRDMLWRRFENMQKKGCTLFYLDSFGNSFEDVKLMQFLREKLGPDVLTFCEQQCDAILPFSGGYSETTLHAEPKDQPPHYRLWSGVKEWEIYQWLAPGAQMAGRMNETKGKAPSGFELAGRWFFRNRITPLLPVSDFKQAPITEYKKWQDEFLTDAAHWKQK